MNFGGSTEDKRARLDKARTTSFAHLRGRYWRVAQVLEDPETRDLTTGQFIAEYLRRFPQDNLGETAIAEAIRRFRADLQNVVAPDLYPHSKEWGRQSAKHQEESKEFYRADEETKAEKRSEIATAMRNPFPDLLKFEDGVFRLLPEMWLPPEVFSKVHEALRDRGYRYAPGERAWKP